MTNADLFGLFRNLTIFLATIMLLKYFIFLNLAAFSRCANSYGAGEC